MRMAYIGFYLIMAGLAAAGAAIDKGVSLATAAAMTAADAALMWLFRDEEEDGGTGKEADDPADKPADGNREGQGC